MLHNNALNVFQFHKVRLKVQRIVLNKEPIEEFQFHKVRLKALT